METFSQNRLPQNRDSNPWPPEHEAEVTDRDVRW